MTAPEPALHRPLGLISPPASWIAAGYALLHLVCLTRYGVFRDELYYVACGEHLAWGYVDHPPLVAFLARAVCELAGESLVALRALSVALGAGTILLAAALARRLGGGRWAQALAALAVAAAPHFFFVFHTFSMNPAEVFLWTAGAYLVVSALQEPSPRTWILLGIATGLGLLAKISMGVYGLGLAVGLLAGRARGVLRSPWPWIAAMIAGLLFLPHVLWQIEHGWPTREFVANAQREKIVAFAVPDHLKTVALMMNPVALPISLAGLWAALRGDRERRLIGCAFLVTLLVFLWQRSKPYYATSAFPPLFALGAVELERWTSRQRVVRALLPALLAAGGLALAPFALPVLPVERFLAYQEALGLRPRNQERLETGELPQHFADMFGWDELAREVSRVYLALPEEERPTARVWAGNYGEAGAIDFYRDELALPPVVCPHNNYWHWGPGPEGGTLIVIGGEREDHLDSFREVELAGRSDGPHRMPYERDLALWVCRGWTVSLAGAWPLERHYD